LAAVAGLIAVAFVANAARTETSDDATRAVRAYIEHYNGRDGAAICRAFTRELRDWFEHPVWTNERFRCAELVASGIGRGEESYSPLFQRLEILSLRSRPEGADAAQVEVTERYHYTEGGKPLTQVFEDRIHLLRRAGRWQVAKPGGVYWLSRSSGLPESALDAPIRNSEAHSPAPQRAVAFHCRSQPLKVTRDARGDAPRPLDVRAASASVEADGSVCVRLTMAAPPPAGIEFKLRVHQADGGRRAAIAAIEIFVRIGRGGRLGLSVDDNFYRNPGAKLRAGWNHGVLKVLWQHAGARRDRAVDVYGYTKTFQHLEPFVRDPLRTTEGDNPPWQGLGDRFGPSIG